jgi:hypothetical protein
MQRSYPELQTARRMLGASVYGPSLQERSALSQTVDSSRYDVVVETGGHFVRCR